MFKKKLSESQKFLKECYDMGAVIEYEEDKGKWVDLPKGLPIDFSKLQEGTIRLKYNEPTYEQVEKFRREFGSPIVTDWDFKNFPILTFCLVKGFCTIKIENLLLEWNPTNIRRYYKVKNCFNPNDSIDLKGVLAYVEREFQNINARINDLYAKVLK